MGCIYFSHSVLVICVVLYSTFKIINLTLKSLFGKALSFFVNIVDATTLYTNFIEIARNAPSLAANKI